MLLHQPGYVETKAKPDLPEGYHDAYWCYYNIRASRAGIVTLTRRPARHLQEILNNCVTVGNTNTFMEVELKGDMETELAILSFIKSRVIERLFFSSRFSSLNTYAVVKAGAILDHRNWPEDV